MSKAPTADCFRATTLRSAGYVSLACLKSGLGKLHIADASAKDRFTTNFFLPDGSYGNVFTGYYSASSGATANLISGNIAFPDGEAGDIYSDIPQARPVTSLLPVPTPWTSTGVGTAIPDSRLGAEPTPSTTAAETMTTPSISLSFPEVISTSGPRRVSTTVNRTGFASYPTSSAADPPAYGTTSSMHEPYGYDSTSSWSEQPGHGPTSSTGDTPSYGPVPTTVEPHTLAPPPEANTSSITPSTGEAPAARARGSAQLLSLTLFVCSLHVARTSS